MSIPSFNAMNSAYALRWHVSVSDVDDEKLINIRKKISEAVWLVIVGGARVLKGPFSIKVSRWVEAG